MGSTIFSIIGPKILGTATTDLFNGLISKVSGGSGINFDEIARILLWLISLYAVSSLFAFIQGIIMTQVTQKTTYRLRRDMAAKINRLPMKFFDSKQHGEVLSLVTNDIDTISNGLNQSATQLITSVTTIVGVLVMMLSIDWIITLVALLVLPISAFFVSQVVKRSQKYFKAQQDYLGHVNGQVEETFGGLDVVQAFNHEEEDLKAFNQANDTLYPVSYTHLTLPTIA